MDGCYDGAGETAAVLHTSLWDDLEAARSLRRGSGQCTGRPGKGGQGGGIRVWTRTEGTLYVLVKSWI